jgi:hypothetical protein
MWRLINHVFFHYLHIQSMKKDGFTMNANIYKIVKGNILKVSGTYHQVYVGPLLVMGNLSLLCPPTTLLGGMKFPICTSNMLIILVSGQLKTTFANIKL